MSLCMAVKTSLGKIKRGESCSHGVGRESVAGCFVKDYKMRGKLLRRDITRN